MIYNGTNAPGALVMDVEAKQRILFHCYGRKQ